MQINKQTQFLDKETRTVVALLLRQLNLMVTHYGEQEQLKNA